MIGTQTAAKPYLPNLTTETTPLRGLMESVGMTAGEISRETGWAISGIHQILNGTYKGSSERYDRVKAILEDRRKNPVQKWQTEGQRTMAAALKITLEERCFSCIVGDSGIGKTTTVREFMRKHPRVNYFKCAPHMSRGALLAELLNHFGCKSGGASNVSSQANLRKAFCDGNFDLFVVDEADLLVKDGSRGRYLTLNRLEVFRELWEASHDANGEPTKGLVFVGLTSLTDLISRVPDNYIVNRLRYTLVIDHPEQEEYSYFLHQLCGVNADEKSADIIHRAPKIGNLRRLQNLAATTLRLGCDLSTALAYHKVMDTGAKA